MTRSFSLFPLYKKVEALPPKGTPTDLSVSARPSTPSSFSPTGKPDQQKTGQTQGGGGKICGISIVNTRCVFLLGTFSACWVVEWDSVSLSFTRSLRCFVRD